MCMHTHPRMLLIGVRVYFAYLSSNVIPGCVPERWLAQCSSLLEVCWSLWVKAEAAARAKTMEEESLYRYRTKTHHIADDEVAEEEGVVRELFPVYDNEFEEGLEAEGSGEPGGTVGVEGRKEVEDDGVGVLCQFSDEEMEGIAKLHMLVFTKDHSTLTKNLAQDCGYSLAAALASLIGPIPGQVAINC